MGYGDERIGVMQIPNDDFHHDANMEAQDQDYERRRVNALAALEYNTVEVLIEFLEGELDSYRRKVRDKETSGFKDGHPNYDNRFQRVGDWIKGSLGPAVLGGPWAMEEIIESIIDTEWCE